jgi:hypothetical protein
VERAALRACVLNAIGERRAQITGRAEQPDQDVRVEGDALQGAARLRPALPMASSRSSSAFQASDA